jgi:CRISPR-associated endonuclease/helicase Cas3
VNPTRETVPANETLQLFWAKSSIEGGHPLIQHMLDVAAVAHALLARQSAGAVSRLSKALSLPVEPALAWSAALCGLHDLGKATPGFQAKWAVGHEKVQQAGFPFPRGAPERHDASTRHLLVGQLLARGLSLPTANRLSEAVAAHHGFPISPAERQQVALFELPASWSAAISSLANGYFSATVGGLPAPTLTKEPATRSAFLQWLAGLCATSDWIGSSVNHFPHRRTWRAEQQFLQEAISLAELALDRIGIQPVLPYRYAQSQILEKALPAQLKPRPLQAELASILQSAAPEPLLIIIEAPMGEGKTEAAFAVDAWARQAYESKGTYFAMPTQATSNALYARVASYLARVAGSQGNAELQLAHGSSTLEDARLRLQGVGFGEDDASVTVSAWFAGHRRTLLAPNAVGTVDQAIVAMLNAKHHFVRLFGLADRVVILDEVHAYDAYTGGLIERLVAWLRHLGCCVVVMSATLPAERRSSLIRAFDPAAASMAYGAYPRVTCVQPGQSSATRTFATARKQIVQVEGVGTDPGVLAARAIEASRHGAAVLVVANTVRRAQAIYGALPADMCVGKLLFHARFPMDERLALENTLLDRFGPGAGEREGWIVVATQVAEQSLDVDFDLLISDVAPVDLLLQRVGRLHRHERTRPAYASTPRVLVAGLGTDGSVDHSAYRPVYQRLPVIRTGAALAQAAAADGIHLPDDIDRLVQHVYGDEPPKRTDAAFLTEHEQARMDWAADLERMTGLAALAAQPLPAEWPPGQSASRMDDEAAANGLARFGTRLGDESLNIVPLHTVDVEYRVKPDQSGWPLDQAVPQDAAAQLAKRYLRISHPGLIAALRLAHQPPGWDRHPLLANHHALVLDQAGCSTFNGISVRLDRELGLLIGSESMPRGQPQPLGTAHIPTP